MLALQARGHRGCQIGRAALPAGCGWCAGKLALQASMWWVTLQAGRTKTSGEWPLATTDMEMSTILLDGDLTNCHHGESFMEALLSHLGGVEFN